MTFEARVENPVGEDTAVDAITVVSGTVDSIEEVAGSEFSQAS